MSKIIVIDDDLCIGCEACSDVCPEVFEVNRSINMASVKNPDAADLECVLEAIELCPVNCISFEDE